MGAARAKRPLSCGTVGLAVTTIRVALAVVFATAAVGKLLDLAGSRRAAAEFGLPAQAADLVGTALPIAELAIAAGLVVTPSARWAGLAALILLGMFMLAIGRLMRRGEAPDCHCFGAVHSEPVGAPTLVRNGVLAAGAALALADGPGGSLGALRGEDVAVIAVSVLALAAMMYASSLWQDNRELRKRPRARPAGPTGLPVGTPAPDLRLSTLSKEKLALGGLIGQGTPALLVQVSPSCGPCRALAPELSRWQKSLADDLKVIVIGSGEFEATAAFAQEIGLPGLLCCGPAEFRDAYQVGPTPSAVLLDGAGRVAARTVAGQLAIEALIRAALTRAGTEVPSRPLDVVQVPSSA